MSSTLSLITIVDKGSLSWAEVTYLTEIISDKAGRI